MPRGDNARLENWVVLRPLEEWHSEEVRSAMLTQSSDLAFLPGTCH